VFHQFGYTPSRDIKLINLSDYRRYAAGYGDSTENSDDKRFVEMILRVLAQLAGPHVETEAIGSAIREGLGGLGVSRGQASALLALYDAVSRVRGDQVTIHNLRVSSAFPNIFAAMLSEELSTEDDVPEIIQRLPDGALGLDDLDTEDEIAFVRALIDNDEVLIAMQNGDAGEARSAIVEVIEGRGLLGFEVRDALADYNEATGFESAEVREAREEVEELEASLAEARERLAQLSK
jgi:hypothetical protein